MYYIKNKMPGVDFSLDSMSNLRINYSQYSQSLVYPIFTFRWLAVHALAVPAVFFIGSIVCMQFLDR